MEKVIAKMDMEAFRQLKEAEDEATVFRLISYLLAGKLSTHESYSGISPEQIVKTARHQVGRPIQKEEIVVLQDKIADLYMHAEQDSCMIEALGKEIENLKTEVVRWKNTAGIMHQACVDGAPQYAIHAYEEASAEIGK